jgi:hypothetical protein
MMETMMLNAGHIFRLVLGAGVFVVLSMTGAQASDGGWFNDAFPSPREGTRDLIPHHDAKLAVVSISATSGSKVEEGAAVRFTLRCSKSGWGHMYVVSASGRVQLWMENVPVAAGETLHWPFKGTTVRAVSPNGTDHIVFIATKHRLDGFDGRETTRDPQALDMGVNDFKDALRDRLTDLPRSEWSWAETTVKVLD